MGFLISFFTSKIAGPIFGVAALAMGIALAVVKIQNGVLHDEIDNPKTGYKHELAVASGNVSALDAGLKQCNAGVANEKQASDAATARANAAIAALDAERAKMQGTVDAILAEKPGKDVCASAWSLIKRHQQ